MFEGLASLPAVLCWARAWRRAPAAAPDRTWQDQA
jgi:hypothetical protein